MAGLELRSFDTFRFIVLHEEIELLIKVKRYFEHSQGGKKQGRTSLSREKYSNNN